MLGAVAQTVAGLLAARHNSGRFLLWRGFPSRVAAKSARRLLGRDMNNLDLRQRLDALGWTQRELANVLGIHEGYVSHLLAGHVPVTAHIAAAVDAAVDAKLGVEASHG